MKQISRIYIVTGKSWTHRIQKENVESRFLSFYYFVLIEMSALPYHFSHNILKKIVFSSIYLFSITSMTVLCSATHLRASAEDTLLTAICIKEGFYAYETTKAKHHLRPNPKKNHELNCPRVPSSHLSC